MHLSSWQNIYNWWYFNNHPGGRFEGFLLIYWILFFWVATGKSMSWRQPRGGIKAPHMHLCERLKEGNWISIRWHSRRWGIQLLPSGAISPPFGYDSAPSPSTQALTSSYILRSDQCSQRPQNYPRNPVLSTRVSLYILFALFET